MRSFETDVPTVTLTQLEIAWLIPRFCYFFGYLIMTVHLLPIFERGVTGRAALGRVWRAERFNLAYTAFVYFGVTYPIHPWHVASLHSIWDVLFVFNLVLAIGLYKKK